MRESGNRRGTDRCQHQQTGEMHAQRPGIERIRQQDRDRERESEEDDRETDTAHRAQQRGNERRRRPRMAEVLAQRKGGAASDQGCDGFHRKGLLQYALDL